MSADYESNSSNTEPATDETAVPERNASQSAQPAADNSGKGKPASSEAGVISGNLRTGELDNAEQLALVEGPKNGKLTLKADGSFTFEPSADAADAADDGEFISITFTFQFVNDTGEIVTRKAVLSGTAEEFNLSTMTEGDALATQLRVLLEDETEMALELELSAGDGITPEQLAEEIKLAIAQRQAFDFVEFGFRNFVSLGSGGTVSVDDIVEAIRSGNAELPDNVAVTDRSNETDDAQIEGTSGSDIIVAGAGGDTVAYRAGQGNDTVDGGAGFDLVSVDLAGLDEVDDDPDDPVTLAPRDVSIRAVNGNVVLDGGDFELTLNGVEEILLTSGNAGGNFTIGDLSGTDIADDTIILIGGNGATNIVNESDRSLEFRGSARADSVVGGSSSGLLFGRGGNDTLDGGAGNDTIFGGIGVDSLLGGAGDDVLIYGRGDSHSGGTGTDTLRVSSSAIDVATLISGGFSGIEIVDFVDDDRADVFTIDLASAQALNSAGQSSLRVQGGSGDQVFITAANWTASGQAVEGGVTYNVHTATGGFRLLVENTVAVVTTTAIGRPTFPNLPSTPQDGAAGEFPNIPAPETVLNDQLGLQDPLLRAGVNVVISSAPGIGQITGAIASFNQAANAVAGFVNAFSGTSVTNLGTLGADQIRYSAGVDNLNPGLSSEDYATALSDVQGAVTDLAINFVIGLATAVVKNLVGGSHVVFAGAGNDIIEGHSGNWDDFFDGGAGNDTMRGGKGNDIYVVGDAGDVVVEAPGQGTDAIRISSNLNYTMAANVENLFGAGGGAIVGNGLNNYMGGNGGANNLRGGAGNDTLDGKGGDDTLSSDAGVNLLFGGSGNDTYRIGDGDDIIFENKDAGIDAVSFAGFSTGPADGQSIDLQALEFAGRLYGTVENVILQDGLVFDVIGGRPANLNGFGNYLDNFLQGNKGNNLLVGRDGNDTLIGGEASLNGVDGFDTLEGGAGDDVYLVSDANDVINDTDGNDTIRIQGTAAPVLGADPSGTFAGQIVTGFGNLTFTYTLPNTSIIERLELGEIAAGTTGVPNPNNLTPNQNLNAVGGAGNNLIIGNSGNNSLTARGGDDTLQGGAGNDTLKGDSGADSTAGAAGKTSMVGGAGNDTYELFNSGDVVLENADEGTDTITSGRIDVSLTNYSRDVIIRTGSTDGGFPIFASVNVSFIENIVLTGTSNLNAVGDDFANTITSNSGTNRLSGGKGDDKYLSVTIADVIIEKANEGNDSVTASGENVTLAANVETLVLGTGIIRGIGNGSGGTVVGNTLNNVLVSGVGVDTLSGGAGDDTYFINNTSDGIFERGPINGINDGTDKALSSVSFTLPTGVENLELTGAGNTNGTGNSLANTITGNSGNNLLQGGAGADLLIGGAGNDTLFGGDDFDVDTLDGGAGNDVYRISGNFAAGVSSQDVIINELIDVSLGGIDLIEIPSFPSLEPFKMPETGIENLRVTTEDNSIDVTGNNGSNEITGNSKDNIIRGLRGDDTIIGNGGRDNLFGNEGADTLDGRTMFGGSGSDTFRVSDANQLVIDQSGTADNIESSISYVTDAALRSTLIDLLGSYDEINNPLTSADFNVANNVLDKGDPTSALFATAQQLIANGSISASISGLSGFNFVIDALPGLSLDAIETVTLTGTAAINATGGDAGTQLVGNAANNRLDGKGGNDTLTGNGGNDTLIGGSGVDSLVGGAGDDTYYAENEDTIVEAEAAGTDTVLTERDFTLNTANVESVTLLDARENVTAGTFTFDLLDALQSASAAQGATFISAEVVAEGIDSVIGSASFTDGTVTYTGANNLSSGQQLFTNLRFTTRSAEGVETTRTVALTLTGDDVNGTKVTSSQLQFFKGFGATGNDSANTITGNSGSNTLSGLGGADTLIGGAGDDTLKGGADADSLTGGEGNDSLDGGTGVDTLSGGAGNDTYLIDSADDVFSENANEGTDTVQIFKSLDLASDVQNIENATLLESAGAADLSGTELNNVLTGNASANVLDGRGGDDTLVGGDGGDTYVVDSTGDVVSESGASGTDLVKSSISFTLGSTLENLTLTGDANINATGNTGNNTLTGNSGNNTFVGGGGNDIMVGGAGDDTFNVESFDVISEIAEFRVEENQTLVANLSDLFDSVPGSPNFQLFNQSGAEIDRDAFTLDATTGILTFKSTQDFENAADTDGDNVFLLSVQAQNGGTAVNFAVRVTDDTVEGTTVLAGAGNEKVTQLLVDGTGTTFAIATGGDRFQVDANGNVSFRNTQTTTTASPLRVEVSVTQSGITNIIALDVTVASNPDGRVDTIERVKSVNITPLKDVSNDTAVVSDPTSIVTLADNVENLTLATADAETLNGNSRDNVIIGNAGNDSIDGKGGNDTLKGGAGDDTYTVDAGDVIEEQLGFGSDTVIATESYTLSANIENLTLSGSANINGTGSNDANVITGNSGDNAISGAGGNDTLVGNAGNDTLDGGTGDDSMRAGTGNDTYVVDSAGDIVDEGLNQGTDTIETSLTTFSLASLGGIENLTFTATGAATGTGNALNNTIIGNSGNDTLDGGAGNDRLEGKAGDDVFTVDSVSDTIVELANEGTDSVNASVSVTLSDNVENVTLTGSANIDATGNALANTLSGNSGTNILKGLGGDDTIVYSTADTADTIQGGDGTDTLNVSGSNVTLDLPSISNMTGIEVINFTGTGSHTVKLDESSVNTIAGGTLKVLGEAGDKVSANGNWVLETDNQADANGVLFDVYKLGATNTRIEIQDGIEVRVINPQPSISVDDLDGNNGFKISGNTNYNWNDFDVNGAGDLDGDGFADLVIGLDDNYSISYDGSYYDGGRAFVVFGSANGPGASFALETIDGSNGFALVGAYESLGSSVAAAGDINGDGVDDLVVGDPSAGDNFQSGPNGPKYVREGISYVVFGAEDNTDGTSNFASEITASNLEATGTTDGFALRPFGEGAKSGRDVTQVGDFNGDGIDDLAISGQYKGHDSQREGSIFIVFGTGDGFDGTEDLQGLHGRAGIEITASSRTNDQVGSRISAAGDVNGDGFDDIIFGEGAYSGSSTFVVFGTDSGAISIDVDDLDGTNGFELYYGSEAVAGGGDFNGDGFDDLVIGVEDYGAWVLFGASDMASVMSQLTYSGGFYASNNLFALDPAYGGDGSLGYRIVSGTDSADEQYLGGSAAVLGDINGDGYDDFVLGAYRASYNSTTSKYEGSAYVVFGSASNHGGKLDLDNLDGTNGFSIDGGYYYLGNSVGAAGDVNGDGFADVVVGEQGEYVYSNKFSDYVYQGAAYIVYGKDFDGSAGTLGSSGNDQLTASGADAVVSAGNGDDTVTISSTDFFRLNGGAGSDTLSLDGAGLTLDFDSLQSRAVRNFETIDLTGSGDNTLTLNHVQASVVLGTALTLQVNGDSGDVVNLPRGSVVSVGANNTTYTANNTVISVANAVTVVQQEFAPVFVNSATSYDVNENTTAVADMRARDKNADTLTYSISGGADSSFFSIDSSSGKLKFSSAPDFETPQGSLELGGSGNDNSYVVNVTATDTSGRAATQALTVNVTNVQEAPAITISGGSNVFSVANAAGATGVTFTTTDPENDTVTLTLTGVDAAGDKFTLFGGSLQTAFPSPAADANGDGVYELTLTATDATGKATTQKLFVGVNNGTNGVPLFEDGTSTEVTITEGDTSVGTFSAFDVDGQTLTYGIAAGDNGALFNIDSSTGALSFITPPTYTDGTTAGENTYRVTVTATDGTATTNFVVDATVAYKVTSTPATLDNFNSNVSGSTNETGEILDFSNLLSGVGGPTDAKTAFEEGWLNFRRDVDDNTGTRKVVVQFDSDGGGDDYVDILTIDNSGNNRLAESDTDLLLF